MENPKRYSEKIKRKDDGKNSGFQIPAGSYNMMDSLSIIKPLFEPHFKSIHSSSGTIRAKLEISQPEDESEIQADEMAESFMDGDVEHSFDIIAQEVPEISPKGEGGAMQTSNEFDQQLQNTKGQGQQLDQGIKGELEEHTGKDLSGVNIHTNSQAHDMSESINAKAFAHGQDIYFKQGNYSPQSDEGKSLLAHEVAHTVQNRDSVYAKIQRKPGDGDGTDPPKEVRYSFVIEIDQVYNEQGYLQKCLEEIFNLTPDDAKLFIKEGWKFTEGFTPITDDEIGKTRNASVSKNDYERLVGKIAEKSPGSTWGLQVAELSAELEKVKNRYDEAYAKYNAVSSDFLWEYNASESSSPIVYADNTRTVRSTPQGIITSGNTGEPYDQMLVREEQAKEDGKFAALKKEYPDIEWNFKGTYMELEDLAAGVVDKYRIDNVITDRVASALEYAIVAHYRSSKQKALHQLISNKLTDASITATDELIYYETLRNESRQIAIKEGLVSEEVIVAWAGASIEILKAQVAFKNKTTITEDPKPIVAFYDALIPFIGQRTQTTEVNVKGLKSKVEINPIIEPYKLRSFRAIAAEPSPNWSRMFEEFREASHAMDKLIVEKLREKGITDEADKLSFTAEATIVLDRLKERYGKVYKVNALYYYKGFTDYMNLYGKEQIVNMGVPLQLYLWRDNGEWGLTDLTRAGSGSIPENRNQTLDNLFGELDSKLRFPEGAGTLFWDVPELGQGGFKIITGDMSLSEWFTYIGLAISAILLAAATFGASIPATVIIFASAMIITGSILSMVEKHEQGMLTAKDVVLELANIVSAAAGGITAGLGKLIVRGAGTSAMAARIAVLADRLFFPVFVTGLAADMVSFATITADALAQYQALDKMPDGPAKEEAKKRLFASFILQGTVTVLSMKGDLPALNNTKNLRLTMNLKNDLVARQDFTEQIHASLDSPDIRVQLEGKVAKWVEKDLVSFQRKVPPDTGEIGELDIELEDIIIETTISKTGKLDQIKKYMTNTELNPDKKKVILYSEDYNWRAQKHIEDAGAYVAKNQQELMDIITLIRTKQ